MKSVKFAVLLLALMPFATPSATAAQDPKSEYARAVASYVEGATNETIAYRKDLEASLKTATEDQKKRLEPASAKLVECEKVVARLKEAGPSSFDTLKAEYERKRAQLVKALQSAK
jgi:hypothetical protein